MWLCDMIMLAMNDWDIVAVVNVKASRLKLS